MKIGILYPRSNAHPGMMMDFMDGIKTALKRQQLNDHIRLISESVGLGGQEKEVYEKAEKLLMLEGVDILVGYLDLRVMEILKPLLYASGKLVVVVNPGANYPQNWVPQQNIINLTLQHSFLCWLSGMRATQLSKANAVTATSFYDCGYLHTAAMVKGFIRSGGEIKYNYVNNQRYDKSFEIKQLTEYLSQEKQLCSLLCVYDSLPASLFYAQLNTFDEAGSLQLFVSPMMLEQEALEKIADRYQFSIEGYIPWHFSAENNSNQEFIESYQQQTNRKPTIFSLLGWETGFILQEIYLQNDGQYTDGIELAGKLAKVKINSPRGELKLDTETNYFIAPVYKCSVKSNSDKITVEYIAPPEKEWAEFVGEPLEGVSSGWTNTYLCY